MQADQDILTHVSMFRNNLQMFLDNLIFAPLYLFSKAKVILILLSAYNVTFEPLATRDGAHIKRSRIEVVFHGQHPKNTPYAFKIQKKLLRNVITAGPSCSERACI